MLEACNVNVGFTVMLMSPFGKRRSVCDLLISAAYPTRDLTTALICSVPESSTKGYREVQVDRNWIILDVTLGPSARTRFLISSGALRRRAMTVSN